MFTHLLYLVIYSFIYLLIYLLFFKTSAVVLKGTFVRVIARWNVLRVCGHVYVPGYSRGGGEWWQPSERYVRFG